MDGAGIDDALSSGVDRPSISRNSLARLASIVTRVALGTISAVVTARVLGPDAKGTLSSLLFATALLSYAASLGLGDASTVVAGRGATSLRGSLARSTPVVVVAIVLGFGGLAALAAVADWAAISVAVALAAALLAVSTFGNVMTSLMDAMERLTFTAAVMVAGNATALVLTILFVAVLDLDVAGGVAGALGGAVVVTMAMGAGLRRAGFEMRPRLDRRYLRQALPLGVVLQSTTLLVALADRVDLLLVYALAGAPEAGIYAVALSIGQLASYASSAIANAVFPRVAAIDAHEVRPLVGMAVRVCFLLAVPSAIAIVIVSPVLLPQLFGDEYRSAVAPAMVIAVAAAANGPQLTLARAIAARDRPLAYFASFGVSVTSMVALDALLVPVHGAMGAAVAALVASALGLAVAIWAAHRTGVLTMADLVVRSSDARHVVSALRALPRRGDAQP